MSERQDKGTDRQWLRSFAVGGTAAMLSLTASIAQFDSVFANGPIAIVRILALVTFCLSIAYLDHIGFKLRRFSINRKTIYSSIAVVVSLGIYVLLPTIPPSATASSSESEQIPTSQESNKPSTRTEQRPRSRDLQSWVSDVNNACAPVNSQVEVAKSNYEDSKDSSSTDAQIETMRNLRSLLGPLIHDVNRIELPSDTEEKRQANDWLRAYNDLYREFITVIGALDDATNSGPLGEVTSYQDTSDAYQEFMDVQATAKGKGDALGIECPASNVTN